MPAQRPLEERLQARLASRGECLVWTGAVSTSGYGVIGVGGSATDYTHRVAYRMANGQIPDGLQIDHLCRERLCANPDHLEAVTQEENLRRELHVRWAGRETCSRGHSTEEWRRVMPSGRTYCAACRRGVTA